jgi:hypothetical protein
MRESAIYWLCDEDLEALGYNADQVTDEQFENIRVLIAEAFDAIYQDLLAEAATTYLDETHD